MGWVSQFIDGRYYNKHTCREVSPGLDAPRVAGRDYALGHPAKVGFRNLGLGFRVFLGLGLALGLGLVLYLGLGLVLG